MNANRFLEHPNSVNEGYWQHFRAAMGYSTRLFRYAFCCAIHAVFPWLHIKTGSQGICDLHEELQARNAIPAQTAANDTAVPPSMAASQPQS